MNCKSVRKKHVWSDVKIEPYGMVRDYGFLFKIFLRNIDFLFPEQKTYDLTELLK